MTYVKGEERKVAVITMAAMRKMRLIFCVLVLLWYTKGPQDDAAYVAWGISVPRIKVRII